jgi:hypothetical protein
MQKGFLNPSGQGGKALDEHIEGFIGVEHADPHHLRVSSEPGSPASDDLLLAEEVLQVTDFFLLTAQPRKCCNIKQVLAV